MKTAKILRYINVPRLMAVHVMGKNHNEGHHMVAGVVVMVVGVMIAKSAEHLQYEVLKYLADMVGYAIHGIGLTPYVEALLRAEGVE